MVLKRVAGFLRGDFSGVHGVVAELLLGELMLGVTNLAIRRDALGIEFYLHLHVRRGDMQRAASCATNSVSASSGVL